MKYEVYWLQAVAPLCIIIFHSPVFIMLTDIYNRIVTGKNNYVSHQNIVPCHFIIFIIIFSHMCPHSKIPTCPPTKKWNDTHTQSNANGIFLGENILPYTVLLSAAIVVIENY